MHHSTVTYITIVKAHSGFLIAVAKKRDFLRNPVTGFLPSCTYIRFSLIYFFLLILKGLCHDMDCNFVWTHINKDSMPELVLRLVFELLRLASGFPSGINIFF